MILDSGIQRCCLFGLGLSSFILAERIDTEQPASAWAMGLRPRQATSSLQVFSGALGGQKASEITNSGDTERPFLVDDDTFTDYQSAADRACDNQKNKCADLANSKQGGDLKVGDCDRQNEECKASAKTATQTSFQALVSEDAQFQYFCDL